MANNQTKNPYNFLTSTQLISLAIIIFLASTSLISLQDLAFSIFSIIYIYFLSLVAFPSPNPSKDFLVFDPNSKILNFYVFVGAVVGLLLPLLYIIQGLFVGNKEGIKAAAPHLFLLASQVFMEGAAFTEKFSIPVHVFVPVFYNSKRIFSITDWLVSEFSYGEEVSSVGGKGLALANMGFWCFNLFGFLLPVYLPRAFAKYYSTSKVEH